MADQAFNWKHNSGYNHSTGQPIELDKKRKEFIENRLEELNKNLNNTNLQTNGNVDSKIHTGKNYEGKKHLYTGLFGFQNNKSIRLPDKEEFVLHVPYQHSTNQDLDNALKDLLTHKILEHHSVEYQTIPTSHVDKLFPYVRQLVDGKSINSVLDNITTKTKQFKELESKSKNKIDKSNYKKQHDNLLHLQYLLLKMNDKD